jgi:micrococcal nuclease
MRKFVISVVLILFSVLFYSEDSFLDKSNHNKVESGAVLSVIDGDTITVRIGEVEEKVRYIGIDTPEPYRDGKPACFSHEATDKNKQLVEGKEVTLVADREDRDAYGRLLRYVYVGDVFVNKVLLDEGYARTLRVAPNTLYAKDFADHERQAQVDNKGMWGACAVAQ